MPPARRRKKSSTSWGRRLLYSLAPVVVLAVGGLYLVATRTSTTSR